MNETMKPCPVCGVPLTAALAVAVGTDGAPESCPKAGA